MLRKLVINDWVHVSSGLVLEDGRRMVKSDVPVQGGFCWEVGSNAEKLDDHRIENEGRICLLTRAAAVDPQHLKVEVAE